MKKKVVYTTAVLCVVMITALSVIKLPDLDNSVVLQNEDGFTFFDKVIHLIFYFILNSILLLAFELRSPTQRLIRSVCVSVCVILYGCIIEIVQHQIGRECSVYDVIANTLGVSISALLFRNKRVNNMVMNFINS